MLFRKFERGLADGIAAGGIAAIAAAALVGFSPHAEAGQITNNITGAPFAPTSLSAQTVNPRGTDTIPANIAAGGASGFYIVIPASNPRGIGFPFYIELNVEGAEFSGSSVSATLHGYDTSTPPAIDP